MDGGDFNRGSKGDGGTSGSSESVGVGSLEGGGSNQAGALSFRLEEWFPGLPPQTLVQFTKYRDILFKFNKTINLISAKAIPQIDLFHFADSIIASQMIYNQIQDKEVYDVGSGNGFPGIVYSILFPQSRVHLIEGDGRKGEFLKQVVSDLELKNTDVLQKRIELFPEGSIKYAFSRGFAPIYKAILITRKVFSQGGVFFHLKGEEWPNEVAQIPSQLCSIWEPKLVGEYRLPVGEIRYAIVSTLKLQI